MIFAACFLMKNKAVTIMNKGLERDWVVLFLNFNKSNTRLNPGFSCGSCTHVDEHAGLAHWTLEKWPCDHYAGPRSQANPEAMNLNPPSPQLQRDGLNDEKSPNGEED